MSAPTTPATWDSNSVNLETPTSGHQASGYGVGEVPTSTELNGWMQIVGLWIAYLQGLLTRTRCRFPAIISAINWAVVVQGSPADGSAGDPTVQSNTGAGSFLTDIAVDEGRQLSKIELAVYGNASANLILTVQQCFHDATLPVTLCTRTITGPAASWSDYAMQLGTISGLTVTVSSSAGQATYTRSTGSYLTDGFFVGQSVTWAGFANAGNNVTSTITVLTATVMTTTSVTYVSETGPALGEAVTVAGAVTVDDTFGLRLLLQSSASGLIIKDLRDTTIAT